jgi:hypothetical protein
MHGPHVLVKTCSQGMCMWSASLLICLFVVSIFTFFFLFHDVRNNVMGILRPFAHQARTSTFRNSLLSYSRTRISPGSFRPVLICKCNCTCMRTTRCTFAENLHSITYQCAEKGSNRKSLVRSRYLFFYV